MLRLAACKLVAGTSAARIGCRRQSRIKQVKQTWNVATRLASCISATSQLVGRPTSEQHLWQRMMISVAAPQLASVIPVAPGGSSTRPSLTRRAAETVMKNMKKHMCAADVHQSAERCRNMQKLFLDLDLRSCPKINHTESGIPDI